MKISVEKLVYGGDGLARLPADEGGRGKTAFVPFSLPGEELEVVPVDEKPGFVRMRVERVLTESPRRVAAQCRYFTQCGGCHYQHADYAHQLEIKAAILRENLRRIAKYELKHELRVHSSEPWGYRNRTQMKIRTGGSGAEFAIGYYRFNSHDLLPVEECPISSPLINQAIAAFWKLGRAGKIGAGISEVELFADASDEALLVQLHVGESVGPQAAEQVALELRSQISQAAGVIVFRARQRGDEVEKIACAGADTIMYRSAVAAFRVSAGSFFQVNRYLGDELVTIVTEGQSGKMALDLYAGVGLFTTALERKFEHVVAVESSPISHADLRYNAAANVKAVRSMTGQYLQNVSSKLRPDLVVADPPRSGLGESVIHSLVKLGAPRVVYVSCDPATLSRDLGRLLEAGYSVEQAHLVDLFPQTYHLESVFHLVR